jgi:HK97 family phage portal protein
MGFRDFFFNKDNVDKKKKIKFKNISQVEADYSRINPTLFEIYSDVDPLSNHIVFSCIDKISSVFSSLDLILYDEDGNIVPSEQSIFTGITGDSLTQSAFFKSLEMNRLLYGNAYARIIRAKDYSPLHLQILPPDDVVRIVDKDTGDAYYKFRDGGDETVAHHLDIIHVTQLGISLSVILFPLLLLYNKTVEASVRQSEATSQEAFIVKYTASINDAKKAQLIESFKSLYAKKGAGVLIEENGVDIRERKKEPFTDTVKDVLKDLEKTLYDFFGLSPLATNEEILEVVKRSCIHQYQDEISTKIFFGKNIYALFKTNIGFKREHYSTLVRTGIYTINEIRLMENLPPLDIPYCNEPLISKDLFQVEK